MWLLKGFRDRDHIENIVETGEIAHFEQFHLFPQCFLTAFFFIVLKLVYMEEGVQLICFSNDIYDCVEYVWYMF